MKKSIIVLMAIISFVPMAAFAQQANHISCTNLVTPESYGSSGASVTALQTFLHDESYLSVAPTGFFGNLTVAAVKAFQTANNISAVGTVGPITRAAIKNISCNATGIISPAIPASPIVATTSSSTNFPTAPVSVQTPTVLATSSSIIQPIISSESVASGIPGNTVYLYGSGFDQNSSVIFCGNQVASALLSANALSFVVPTNAAAGNCHIQVNEMNGTASGLLSNTQYFTVLPAPISATSTIPIITSVSVNGSSGAALYPGATITISGNNFAANAGVVLGGVPLIGHISSDGTTITFTAPSFVPNTYNLSVLESLEESNVVQVSVVSAPVGGLSIAIASSSASVSNGAIDLGDYTFTNTGTTTAVVSSLTLQEGGSAGSYANPVLTNLYIVNLQNGSIVETMPGAVAPAASVSFVGNSDLFLVPSGASVTIGVRGAPISYQPAPTDLNVTISLTGVSSNVSVSGLSLTGNTINII